MKSTLIVAAIACALSATLAAEFETVEQADADIADYIREQLIRFPMGRSATDRAACYDVLIRRVNNITDSANAKSKDCANTTSIQRASKLENLKQSRTTMVVEVTKIQNSFFVCARTTSTMDYLQCLKNSAVANASVLDGIREKSQQLADQYTNELKAIEIIEKNCLANVNLGAKNETDEAFKTLTACLAQGPAAA